MARKPPKRQVERQRFALAVLADHEGELIEARVVAQAEWVAAQVGGDVDVIFRLGRMNTTVAWAQTLAWLERHGFARREFSDFSMTWRYEITKAGKALLGSAA